MNNERSSSCRGMAAASWLSIVSFCALIPAFLLAVTIPLAGCHDGRSQAASSSTSSKTNPPPLAGNDELAHSDSGDEIERGPDAQESAVIQQGRSDAAPKSTADSDHSSQGDESSSGNAVAAASGQPASGSTLTMAKSAAEWRVISIDGQFDDWQGVTPSALGQAIGSTLAKSSAGASTAPMTGIDHVWCASDANWLYLRISLTGPAVNLQGLPGTLALQFDADGNEITGVVRNDGPGTEGLAGVDFEVDFSPLNAGGAAGTALPPHSGVTAQVFESSLPPAAANPYWFDAGCAPTCAATDFEMRFRRGGLIPGSSLAPFAGSTCQVRLSMRNQADQPVSVTPPFTVEFPPAAQTQTLIRADSHDDPSGRLESILLQPRDPSALRALSWNVHMGSIFTQPEVFARVIHAINPDVICFQELGNDVTTGQVRNWLDQYAPAPFGWDVTLRQPLGTAVASRLSCTAIEPRLNTEPRYATPTSVATMIVAGLNRRILFTSVHLKCCGRAGDSIDTARIAEATEIRRIIRGAEYDSDYSGLVVMGDFNLVGSGIPLEVLTTGTDLDASDLEVANPLVINGRTNATWRDPNKPFLPGRLDYALVSDSVLHVVDSFVLDTERLSESALTTLKLEAKDTTQASDHLPVVIDLR